MKLIKRMLRTAAVLGAVSASLAVGVVKSHAGLEMRIDYDNNGIFDATIVDGGFGDLSAGTAGLITQVGASGPVTVLTNSGTSKDVTGSISNPVLDLATLLVTSGPASVRIQLTDTGFDGAILGFGQVVSIGGTITFAEGTVTTNIYRDLGNSQTSPGQLICSTGPLSVDAFDYFSGACGQLVGLDNQYSLTLETIINLDGAGIVSYDAITRLAREGELDIPEPASIMLLGFGAMGLGAWKRRRKAQQN